jgi:predicted esterase
MKRNALIPALILLLSLPGILPGQGRIPIAGDVEKKTMPYVERDSTLFLDFYQLKGDKEIRPLVLFVFGGGFARGKRDAHHYNTYFNTLVHEGFKVASIDYRLGLSGIYDEVGIFNTAPLKDAIDLAVEDLYQATAYLIAGAEDLGIDPSKIIISGSSAGAITSLHADWYNRNQHELTGILPTGYQYSGVVAFAGAIFSNKGAPKYEKVPAPTLFFHGSEDKTVPYNKRRLFNKGFFGSNYLSRQFEKNEYLFHYYRLIGAGHEVAVTPMKERVDEVVRFIRSAVLGKTTYQEEITLLPLGN